MSGIIYTGDSTKPAHGYFVGWLNNMLNNYQVGFYDEAISNIIKLSFIREHNLYIQEMFSLNGKNLTSFISVIPTDTTNPILMVHGLNGVPTLYNKTDISNIFEFTSEGFLKRFYENVVIPIYDATDTNTHELFISFDNIFGTKAPMLKLKDLATGSIVGTGLLDTDFAGRYSGSYNVKTTPFEDQPYYMITNITKMVITADIPVLPNLTIRYTIEAGHTISVVSTPLTDYYIRNGMDLDALRYRFVGATVTVNTPVNVVTFMNTPPTQEEFETLMGFPVENFRTLSTFNSSQVVFTNSNYIFLGFALEPAIFRNDIIKVELLCTGLANEGLSALIDLVWATLPECQNIIDLGFSGCLKLEKIYAPKLNSIGGTTGNDSVFNDCSQLSEVTVSSEMEVDPIDGDLDYATNTLGATVIFE